MSRRPPINSIKTAIGSIGAKPSIVGSALLGSISKYLTKAGLALSNLVRTERVSWMRRRIRWRIQFHWKPTNRLSGAPGDLPRIRSSYRDWMCKQSLKSSQEGLRIMVEPDLVEHGAPIVVDAFTRELPLFIECVESA